MTYFSRSIAAWIIASFASSAVFAQAAPAASSATQSTTTPAPGAVNGSANDATTSELQRRLSLSHRRRADEIQDANKQAGQLMAANQDAPQAVVPRRHRAPNRHRATTAQGRAAAAHSTRSPDAQAADPNNGAAPQGGSP
jgi:hypothetical protein